LAGKNALAYFEKLELTAVKKVYNIGPRCVLLSIKVGLKQHNSETKFMPMIDVNFVTPKAAF
jgi:hypothetical protein